MKIGNLLKRIKPKKSQRKLHQEETKRNYREYLERYNTFSFDGCECSEQKQYEAMITRWYHTLEKGLAYTDFRAGFGKNNVNALLTAMEYYIKAGYSEQEFFYETALSVLKEYCRKNKEYGYSSEELEKRIDRLPGRANAFGGTVDSVLFSKEEVRKMDYATLVHSRHSMRHFSKEPVEKDAITRAIDLAQLTPSACNRQGWRARVILNPELIQKVLANQNGNEGFGQEFTGLLLLTGDLRYFNQDRELFQVYIDGGMYCQSMLNSLYYEGIASVPLSASLRQEQEKNVRQLLSLEDAEVLLLFIGIGKYPDTGLTTRSERRKADPVFYE